MIASRIMDEVRSVRRSSAISDGVIPGAIGGVVGGLVFGGAMLELGQLPSVASLVRLESSVIGYLVHMAIAAIVGTGLGLLVWHQRPGICETLFWGMAYGMFWWFIGPLTLRPLILFENLAWSVEAAQSAFPALIGHVLYGASAGLAIVLLQSIRSRTRGESVNVAVGPILRGGLAGLIAASAVGGVLVAQGNLHTFVARTPDESHLVSWLIVLAVGLIGGFGFSALYPRPSGSAGAGIIRGVAYGFLAWAIIPLTLLPLLNGTTLPWGPNEVRENFPAFPGYLLFGAALALFFQWLDMLTRLFFEDIMVGSDNEAVGTQGLRATGRGMVAGVVGGLIFAGVMLQIGALTNVASLIGVTSPITGSFVHMMIAVVIGTSYGLLFQRESYDITSALGWGASYGFIWWMLGPLTLFPTFLGFTPLWTSDAVARTFPNLVGHLLYGAGLGITLHLLEARYSPWWVPRRQAQSARVARRREQVLTSAPALWTFIVVLALTIPVLLGTESTTELPGIY